LSWTTSKGFVTVKERIKKIEKVPSIKGIFTDGAIEKYLSLKDYPELSGLTEGGFAEDIYLKKDSKNDIMLIISKSSPDTGVDPTIRISSDDNSNNFNTISTSTGIEGVPANGTGNTYVGYIAGLDKDVEKKVINFWYNGIWNVVNIPKDEDGAFIPIELVRKMLFGINYKESDFVKKTLIANSYESVNVEKLAITYGMGDLFSSWMMNGVQNYMLNTDMRNGPYTFQRTGDNIYIKFNIGFKDSTNYAKNDTNIKQVEVEEFNNNIVNYENAIIEGFNMWIDTYSRGQGEISNYGFGDINVSVTITQTNDKNTNKIYIINSFDKGLYVKHEADKDNEDYWQISNVDTKGWKINAIGKMTMYSFFKSIEEYDSDGQKKYDPDGHNYYKDEYIVTAGHEFGHLIGIGDAYEKGLIINSEIIANEIMMGGSEITFNDMEMAFLAVLYNRKQDFAGEFKSDAITMYPNKK